MAEPEFKHSDGTVRKKHYGAGKQPWDDYVEMGIAYEFALACTLRYVRRDADIKGSDREEDLGKGRWYAERVKEYIAKADKREPEGRRYLKLYTEMFYGRMNKAERVLLNLED